MPGAFFRNPSLRLRLLAIALAAVLPVAIVSLVILARNVQSQRTELERSAMETVRALTTAVENEINASRSALEILATSQTLAENDLLAFYGRSRMALQRHAEWDNITLLDASGQQLINLRRPFGTALPRAGDIGGMQAVLRTGRPSVSNMVPAPLTADKRFVVRVPVFQDGRVAYVLNASNKPRVMADMLARQRFPAGAVVAIVDSQGTVIARSLAHDETYGKPASDTLLSFMQGRREGFGITRTLEGTEVYTAFMRSPATGWVVAMGVPRAVIDDPVIASYALLTAVIVLSLGAGIAGALFVARTVTRPIAWLGDVARGWRRGQVPEVPPIAIPELREAAEALVAAQAERERLLQSEREARAIAEEGSRSKDEFLAMLGHELRNPLAAITAAVAVIEKSGGASHPAAATATGIIQRQSRHLARLLDDLLDVGRVMTGKILLDRSPVDLAVIVRRAVDSLMATRAGCQQIELAVAPAWVHADASRIEQIVTNLLTNACKYTPPDGRITVSVRNDNGNAVLCVRDTGLGLDPDLLPRVFDLFVQGRRTLDRADGGLGIGLTLVRRLVELHGGSVAARSEGAGKGSEFEVRLPATAAQHASDGAAVPVQSVQRDVLVVEDNADAREMLKALLTLAGHRVHEAPDGPTGVRLAREIRPDVALVDIGLPGFDGYEVASRIRAELDGAIRLVALTGYGLPEDEQRAKDAGFDHHVVKPVDEATLRRLLR
jgi:signal transduction histidine kinase